MAVLFLKVQLGSGRDSTLLTQKGGSRYHNSYDHVRDVALPLAAATSFPPSVVDKSSLFPLARFAYMDAYGVLHLSLSASSLSRNAGDSSVDAVVIDAREIIEEGIALPVVVERTPATGRTSDPASSPTVPVIVHPKDAVSGNPTTFLINGAKSSDRHQSAATLNQPSNALDIEAFLGNSVDDFVLAEARVGASGYIVPERGSSSSPDNFSDADSWASPYADLHEGANEMYTPASSLYERQTPIYVGRVSLSDDSASPLTKSIGYFGAFDNDNQETFTQAEEPTFPSLASLPSVGDDFSYVNDNLWAARPAQTQEFDNSITNDIAQADYQQQHEAAQQAVSQYRSPVNASPSVINALAYWLATHIVNRLVFPEARTTSATNTAQSSFNSWGAGDHHFGGNYPRVSPTATKHAVLKNSTSFNFNHFGVPPYYGGVIRDPYKIGSSHLSNNAMVHPNRGLVELAQSLISTMGISVEVIVAAAWFINAMPLHDIDGENGQALRQLLAAYRPNETFAVERRVLMLGLVIADMSVTDDHLRTSDWAHMIGIAAREAVFMERQVLQSLEFQINIPDYIWLHFCESFASDLACRPYDLEIWQLHEVADRLIKDAAGVCRTADLEYARFEDFKRQHNLNPNIDFVISLQPDESESEPLYKPWAAQYEDDEDAYDSSGWDHINNNSVATDTAMTAANAAAAVLRDEEEADAVEALMDYDDDFSDFVEYDGAAPFPAPAPAPAHVPAPARMATPDSLVVLHDDDIDNELAEFDGAIPFPVPVASAMSSKKDDKAAWSDGIRNWLSGVAAASDTGFAVGSSPEVVDHFDYGDNNDVISRTSSHGRFSISSISSTGHLAHDVTAPSNPWGPARFVDSYGVPVSPPVILQRNSSYASLSSSMSADPNTPDTLQSVLVGNDKTFMPGPSNGQVNTAIPVQAFQGWPQHQPRPQPHPWAVNAANTTRMCSSGFQPVQWPEFNPMPAFAAPNYGMPTMWNGGYAPPPVAAW